MYRSAELQRSLQHMTQNETVPMVIYTHYKKIVRIDEWYMITLRKETVCYKAVWVD